MSTKLKSPVVTTGTYTYYRFNKEGVSYDRNDGNDAIFKTKFLLYSFYS